MPSARPVRRVLLLSVVIAVAVSPVSRRGPDAQPATLAPHQQLMREIYQELIEINALPQTAQAIVNCRAVAARKTLLSRRGWRLRSASWVRRPRPLLCSVIR
jgi:hypothetical protein